MRRMGYFVCVFLIAITGVLLVNNRCVKMSNETEGILQSLVTSDLELIIYYLPIGILTPIPLDNDILTTDYYNYKITISSSELTKYRNQLRQMIGTVHKPLKGRSFFDARIYCVFVNDNNKILYSYSLSSGNSMMINNDLFDAERVFYDFILPFIPNCEVNRFKSEIPR